MTSRTRLEERITEAVDGLLSASQLRLLEEDLHDHPDLLIELHAQMPGTGVRQAYESVQPDPFAVPRLRQQLRQAADNDWQQDVLRIFRRYVVASGVGAILLVAALHALPGMWSATSSADSTIVDEMGLMFDNLEQAALGWSLPDGSAAEEGQ